MSHLFLPQMAFTHDASHSDRLDARCSDKHARNDDRYTHAHATVATVAPQISRAEHSRVHYTVVVRLACPVPTMLTVRNFGRSTGYAWV